MTATHVYTEKLLNRGSKNTDSKDCISNCEKGPGIHDGFLLFYLQTPHLSFLLVYKLIRSKAVQLCQLRLQLQFSCV